MLQKIVIVGAGPVGSLAALYAAKRGYNVEVYELRDDLRSQTTTPLNFTKSINLALSERGVHALRATQCPQLLEDVLAATIPMHGRMIHTRSRNGSLEQQSQAYDVHGRFQRSIDRSDLNKRLLNELDHLPNVNIFFQHKLTGADFKSKKAWFEIQTPATAGQRRKEELEISFDLMLGTDGAHSATRYHMMKFARVDYSQNYIDCLWCEFTMPAVTETTTSSLSGPISAQTSTSRAEYAISPNHLHIWPGGDRMFIALPNLDKSFVCTLFAPAALFAELKEALADTPASSTSRASSKFIDLFSAYFPGLTPALITPAALQTQFERNPHLPLVNIKCAPHHFGSSVAILGDAANAIVPFYGQGMNAGLESVRLLFEHLDAQPLPDDASLAAALARYTTSRVPDTHAIADLALGNYIEMSSSVTDPLYKLRKRIEETLDWCFPRSGWKTQYSRVAFGNEPYADVIHQSERQKIVLERAVRVMGLGVLGAAVVLGLRARSWFVGSR